MAGTYDGSLVSSVLDGRSGADSFRTPSLHNPANVDLLRVVCNEWTYLEDSTAVVAVWTKDNTWLCHVLPQWSEDVCKGGVI